MAISIFSLLILFPVLFASNTDLSEHVKKNCPWPVCELILSQNYSVSSTILLADYTNLSIIGTAGSVVCFDSRNTTHIRVENITNLSIKGIRFEACKNEAKTNDNENSYFLAVNYSVGLSIASCENVEIVDSVFSNFFGNFLQLNSTSNVSVTNCDFGGNSKFLFTQGIHYTSPKNQFSQLHIKDCNFSYLAAEAKTNIFYRLRELIDDIHYLSGAGVYLRVNNTKNVNITFENTSFTNCSAVSGAGIFLKSFTDTSKNFISVRNSRFLRNNASADKPIIRVSGGGIDVISLGNNQIKIEIENCVFEGNFAYDGKGGAISKHLYTEEKKQSIRSILEIRNCSFDRNSAKIGGAIFANGRGIDYQLSNEYNANNSLIIESNTFTSNYADTGGAIFTSMHHIVLQSGNNFSNNSGSNGGAFMLVESILYINGSNTIERNHARVFGGAIYVQASFIHISHKEQKSYLSGNRAGMRGGAVYVNKNYIVPVETLIHHNRPIITGQCFLSSNHTDSQTEKLIFVNNSVEMFFENTNICLGKDIYSKTMVYCVEYKNNGILSLNSTLNYFRGLGVHFNNSNCSITTDVFKISFDLLPMCKVNGSDGTLGDCNDFDQDTYRNYTKDVENSVLSQKLENTTINLVFPGYLSNFSILLRDEFSQSTSFYVTVEFFPLHQDMSRINQTTPRAPVELYPQPSFWRPETNYRILFTNKSESKMEFVQMCIYSVPFFPLYPSCSKLLVSTCPDGFQLKHNKAHKWMCFPNQGPWPRPIFEYKLIDLHNNGSEIEDPTHVIVSPDYPVLIALDNKTNSFVPGQCKYFKCRCHNMANPTEGCNVNLLSPSTQCQTFLTGAYCTKCISNQTDLKLLIPPISILRFFSDNCYPCSPSSPFIWIPLYFVITVIITTIILSLRIDIFNDYTRSIAFYSSVLYLYVVSCGQVSGEIIFDFISLILSVTNLLVSESLPICITRSENAVQFVTLFNNLSPFVYYFYLLVVYLLFQKIPYLQRYNLGKNIHFPMWTLFILTYSNLCVGVFVPFQFNSQGVWIYDSYYTRHTNILLFVTSGIIAVIIVPIPLFLVALSHRSGQRRLHLTENYEKRFKPGFKLWEVMKLSCRFFIALLFPLPYFFPSPTLLDNSCILVSILCLFLLIINSLYQPATNHFANHFESYCLFILSILGILNISHDSLIPKHVTGVFVLSPYFLFVIIKLNRRFLNILRKFLRYKKERMIKSIS